jgi:DNA-directed RNA polymerase beta' subunit
LAQQFIKGTERQKATLTKGTRCWPYSEPYSQDIEDHGFIRDSFNTGVSVKGLPSHLAGARDALIDVGTGTAKSGYLAHRMTKTLEDMTASYDGSIRGVDNNIFQFAYGGDGFNAKNLMKTSSVSLGDFLSFIDLPSTISKLNAEAGY